MNRIIKTFFAVIMCLALISSTVFAATESELKSQKEEAQKKAEAAQYQIDLTQTTIEGIDAELKKAEQQIAEIQNTIDTKSVELTTTQAQLDELNNTLELQKIQLAERIRVMYMYGSDSYLEILFSAKSLTDLLTRVDWIASIMVADQQNVNNLKDTITQIDGKKNEMVVAKQEQEQALASQQSIKEQENQLLSQNQAVLESAKKELEQRNAEIAEAEAGLAEIVRQNAATIVPSVAQQQSPTVVGATPSEATASSSGYIWPSDSHSITDYFGNRASPGGIGSTNHQGIDIGASSGSPIYACASGTVTLASWYGGYGNCVMIKHSDGMTTLYAHQSSIAVSNGQSVTQGQVIGYVGSTGNSTGAHLHLSFIAPSGDFVDPMNYL